MACGPVAFVLSSVCCVKILLDVVVGWLVVNNVKRLVTRYEGGLLALLAKVFFELLNRKKVLVTLKKWGHMDRAAAMLAWIP